MSNPDIIVQWGIDRTGSLAIKYNGEWYGFSLETHPRDIDVDGFLREYGYISFGEGYVPPVEIFEHTYTLEGNNNAL